MRIAEIALIALPASLIVAGIATYVFHLAAAERTAARFSRDLTLWYTNRNALSTATQEQLRAMELPSRNDSPDPPAPGEWHCEYDDPSLTFATHLWLHDGALIRVKPDARITAVTAQCWSEDIADALPIGFLDDPSGRALVAWRDRLWIPAERLPSHDDLLHVSVCGFAGSDDVADAYLITTVPATTQRSGVSAIAPFAWFELLERLLPDAHRHDAFERLAAYVESPALPTQWADVRTARPASPLVDEELAIVGALQTHVFHLAGLLSVVADSIPTLDEPARARALLEHFDAAWMIDDTIGWRIRRWRMAEARRILHQPDAYPFVPLQGTATLAPSIDEADAELRSGEIALHTIARQLATQTDIRPNDA